MVYNGFMLEAGEAAARALFAEYRNNAGRRGIYFGLTLQEFKGLISQDCNYCGAPPEKVYRRRKLNGVLVYNGVDRIDNSEGYYAENCAPCCEVCNRAKNTMDLEDFLAWLQRIAEYYG